MMFQGNIAREGTSGEALLTSVSEVDSAFFTNYSEYFIVEMTSFARGTSPCASYLSISVFNGCKFSGNRAGFLYNCDCQFGHSVFIGVVPTSYEPNRKRE